ncbi:hypothetical protein M3N64_01060 [Sporolactobacillus sp. CPB3-1]|uniref:Uncharacterized protein n=1 Tax=Sporolactobacillus mangiferae TaxID=2940498 RepID=A0ABT0M6Q9_9BACL|nr:hypothetical protein [Sporolactobacillus mangiferae]MCL1630541.1 hypothetical protein [Sporolactobacillus mangiferae]
MIGLLTAVVLFNFFAFLRVSRLTKNQIFHIWTFTIAFQVIIDAFVIQKFHAYWYFKPGVDFEALPALVMLIPPVNLIFLNWYPFGRSLYKRVLYLSLWTVAITAYELVTLLPEPWGYFRYGWWKTIYSFMINPFLLLAVVEYYKLIRKIENS